MARRVDRSTASTRAAGGLTQHLGPIRSTGTVRHRGVDWGSAVDLVVVDSAVDVVAASDGGAVVVAGGDCRNLRRTT